MSVASQPAMPAMLRAAGFCLIDRVARALCHASRAKRLGSRARSGDVFNGDEESHG